jgi:hypothetical protein
VALFVLLATLRATLAGRIVLATLLVVLAALLGTLLLLLTGLLTDFRLILLAGALLALIAIVVCHCVSFHGS